MKMITKHRIVEAFEGEDSGKKLQTLADPLAAVAEVRALWVLSAEESLAHAAVRAVVDTDRLGIGDFGA
jgi:hypothetical protein